MRVRVYARVKPRQISIDGLWEKGRNDEKMSVDLMCNVQVVVVLVVVTFESALIIIDKG